RTNRQKLSVISERAASENRLMAIGDIQLSIHWRPAVTLSYVSLVASSSFAAVVTVYVIRSEMSLKWRELHGISSKVEVETCETEKLKIYLHYRNRSSDARCAQKLSAD